MKYVSETEVVRKKVKEDWTREKIYSIPAEKARKGKEGRGSVQLSQQLWEHERNADEKRCDP